MRQTRFKARWLAVAMTILLVVVMLLGLWLGPPVLTGSENGLPIYVTELRLPRLLAAAGVGAGLALSGALLQGLFRNPLADPSLIGVSAGAAVGASLTIVVFNASLVGLLGDFAIALAACVGGLVAVLIVVGLSVSRLPDRWGYLSNSMMLLVGMAVNALGFALVGLLGYLAQDAALRDLIAWSLGRFEGLGWGSVVWLCAVTLPAIGLMLKVAKPLDVLMLGHQEARQLGVAVNQIQWLVVGGSAVLVGVGVALAGIIGFIGLIAPHIVRLMVGAQHRMVLPLSMLVGAVLLVAAEVLARNIMPPMLLPVGVITAAIGAPTFLILILRSKHQGSAVDA